MTVTLQLASDTERRLRERAAETGQTLEAYLQQLIEREADRPSEAGTLDQQSPLSDEEFDRLLDELSEGLPPLPPLPADFSRADIYADHD
jgi:hypothetical protein